MAFRKGFMPEGTTNINPPVPPIIDRISIDFDSRYNVSDYMGSVMAWQDVTGEFNLSMSGGGSGNINSQTINGIRCVTLTSSQATLGSADVSRLNLKQDNITVVFVANIATVTAQSDLGVQTYNNGQANPQILGVAVNPNQLSRVRVRPGIGATIDTGSASAINMNGVPKISMLSAGTSQNLKMRVNKTSLTVNKEPDITFGNTIDRLDIIKTMGNSGANGFTAIARVLVFDWALNAEEMDELFDELSETYGITL